MHFLQFIFTTRLLKLKGFEDLIITRTNDKLTLAPPNIPSFTNQRIVIHNRILYFEELGIRYSLGMNTKDIYVKLIESTSKVMYMSKKRTVDFFNLEKKETGDKAEKTEDFADPNEKYRVVDDKFKSTESVKPTFPKLIKKPSIDKQTSIDKKTSIDRSNLEIKEKIVDHKTEPVTEMPLIEHKQSHLIESDSTLEDCTHLTIKNVKVNEINSEFFVLASDKNCVTFFADKFIFAPCTKADTQQFAVYKIQELIKKMEYITEQKRVNSSNIDKQELINEFKANRDVQDDNLTVPNSFVEQSFNSKNTRNKISKSFSTAPKKMETKKVNDLSSPGDILARLKSTLESASLDI